MRRAAIRTCPLCEATCGLEVSVEDDRTVGRIRGDAQDVFSHGFVCPKGASLKALHEDPDRLRGPVVRQSDGSFAPVGWHEAFALEATDAIRPGVVSIPHGWGQGAPGARLGVAAEHAGTDSNVLADTAALDPLSGNAVLCGIPVELGPA